MILLDDALHHLHHPALLVGAFEQLAAQAVDGLALLVVDVVVLEQVFAGFEVLRLDGFLRLLDALGDHLGLDRHVFFHAEPQHQVLHALAAENAQQVVLQGEIEARAARIALAAGTAAELVIDAAGFVPLGGDDVQAADVHHLVVFLIGLCLEAGEQLVPQVPADPVERLVVGEVIEVLVGDELGLVLGKALGVFFLRHSSLVMNSGLPPSRMSVPRPAMLVDTVTALLRPAWATMPASRS